MTCIVVDDLLTKFSAHGDVVVAYVYCNYRQHQEQKSEDFLLSILKQLLQRRPQIPEEAKELYHRHQAKGSRPSCDEIRKLVHSIAELFPRVFIIIDALDECHSSDEGRWKIVSEILELGSKTSANIFATSRPVPDIVSWFQYSLKKEISASEDDVLKYIDGRMPNLLRRRIWKHPELQQNIRCTILAAVDGM